MRQGSRPAALSYFNPRSPHGERRTVFVMPCVVAPTFQPTLPARGATGAALPPPSARGISTHAPRTGSDGACQWHPDSPVHFNPRSPHGERRARGRAHNASDDFNPRSPHGERQSGKGERCLLGAISTHAPRTGSDRSTAVRCLHICGFQPTLPARGATEVLATGKMTIKISTHAPRTGSDETVPVLWETENHFNPRSPHGERRLQRDYHGALDIVFQPTLPARGATKISLIRC